MAGTNISWRERLFHIVIISHVGGLFMGRLFNVTPAVQHTARCSSRFVSRWRNILSDDFGCLSSILPITRSRRRWKNKCWRDLGNVLTPRQGTVVSLLFLIHMRWARHSGSSRRHPLAASVSEDTVQNCYTDFCLHPTDSRQARCLQ